MKALLLSPCPDRIAQTLEASGADVCITTGPPAALEVLEGYEPFDWLISFGYQYILPQSILERFPRRAINIHISLLPWNRGADPNFWSWFDNTPKGVSIHQITKGTDTGPILAQYEMPELKAGGHTLRSSYEVLTRQAAAMFNATWTDILNNRRVAYSQLKSGTYHRKADKLPYMKSLPGWDATCEEVERLGQRERERLAA